MSQLFLNYNLIHFLNSNLIKSEGNIFSLQRMLICCGKGEKSKKMACKGGTLILYTLLNVSLIISQ